jgi:PKD domain
VTVQMTDYDSVDVVGMAGPDGAFSVPVGPLPAGVFVSVRAGDSVTRTLARRGFVTGRSPIQIQGAVDQQLVRGVVNFSTNSTASGIGWAIESRRPRTKGNAFSVDTARHPDGPLRVDVADDFNVEDYLYLIVDNTAPSGGAGTDQRVRVGRDAAIVTSAADTNGIANVQVAFGDGATVTQAAAQAGQPLLHRYAAAGDYTVKATITDNAGNVRQDESVVTVTAAPLLRLTGKIPTSVKRGKPLKFTLSTSVAGTLSVQMLGPTGKVVRKATKRTTAANGRAAISIKTKGLKRGRYILVRQLVGADGEAGPVLIGSVRVK